MTGALCVCVCVCVCQQQQQQPTRRPFQFHPHNHVFPPPTQTFLQTALDVRMEVLGEDNPETAEALGKVALVESITGSVEEAMNKFSQGAAHTGLCSRGHVIDS